MQNIKKKIGEEASNLNSRIKKSSISVSLSHTNEGEVRIIEEMSIEEALRQISLLKNKK